MIIPKHKVQTIIKNETEPQLQQTAKITKQNNSAIKTKETQTTMNHFTNHCRHINKFSISINKTRDKHIFLYFPSRYNKYYQTSK